MPAARRREKVIGNIEGAETKRNLSFHSAISITPQVSTALIAERVKAALARRGDFPPYKPAGPVTVEVSVKSYRRSQVLAYLPMFEPIDAYTVRYRAKDMVEATSIMTFIEEYEVGLTR